MRRIAMISSVLAAILLILGLIEWLTNYKWAAGDQNPFAGDQNVLLDDGATVLIAGGLLVVVSVIMWLLALRGGQGGRPPRPALRGGQGGRPPRPALRKGQSDQQRP